MKRYLRLVGSLLIRPRRTLIALKSCDSQLGYAITSLLVHSAFAIAKQIYFHSLQVPPAPEPFLRIPSERTWLYSAYFQIPVDFMQAILFAGVVSLVAPLVGGRGSFKGQFSLFSFGFAQPTILLILGTFILSMLGLGGTVVWWIYFVGVMLWILAVIWLSVRTEQATDPRATTLLTLVAFLVSIGLSLTYIR